MKIVIVGSGGREAALRAELDLREHEVIVTPGRAGIPGSVDTPPENLEADMFVIGPEVPLVEGLADKLRAQGKTVFGPSAAYAQLEGSKDYMKDLLVRAGVPTAKYKAFQLGQEEEAEAYIRDTWDSRIVVKTDGLAAGKGVLVTSDLEEAVADAKAKLVKGGVVIEEALPGKEFSFFAICSGKTWTLLPLARDYKRLRDGDQGPNTGGMGSFSPVDDGPTLEELAPIINAVLGQMDDYRGVLFGGLMVADDGSISVLEFNVRFGDPEIQSILPRLTVDIGELLYKASRGEKLDMAEVPAEGACVTVVLASPCYPEAPQTGDIIRGIENAEQIAGVTVLHAGAELDTDGSYKTAGGRVLNIVVRAETVADAAPLAQRAADLITLRRGEQAIEFERRRDIAT